MSINQHRYLSLALAVLSVVLLVCLLRCLAEFGRYRANVRYAHDVVSSFLAYRDLALKADVPEAVYLLQRLDSDDEAPSPPSGSLSSYVEGQRRRAVADILTYLRAKTGKDFGTNLDAWYQEYHK